MPLPYNSVLGILTEGLLGGAGAEEDGLGGVGADCASTPAATRLYWALDVDLAGVVYHFATSDVEVDGVQYASGLAPIEQSKVLDLDAAVELEVTTADSWPRRFAAAQWLVDGGAATLWLVAEENGARRRIEWLRGTIAVTSWDVAGQPLALTLRGNRRDFELPNPRGVVDSYTQPEDPAGASDTGFEQYPAGLGQFYPLILGYPGYDDAAGTVYTVVPIPVILYTTQVITVLDDDEDPNIHPTEFLGYAIACVAGGQIDAAMVKFDYGFEVSAGFVSGGGQRVYAPAAESNLALTEATDKLGQRYQYIEIEFNLDGDDVPLWSGDPRPFAGFSPTTGFGGGILWQGEVLRGAADIFEWIVKSFTTLRLDAGRHRASAATLNAYRFDAWINEPVSPLDWYADKVLAFIPAKMVIGADGVYLAHIPLSARATDVVLELEEGRNAERAGLTSTADSEIVNELTVRWAITRDTSTFYQTRVFTAEQNRPVALANGATYYDTRATASALARVSQQRQWKVRPGSLDLPTVWESATAYKIAQDRLAQSALPVRRLTYTVAVEQHVRVPGEVVRLTDAGMALDGVLCVVEDVRVSTAQVELVLRSLRSLTDYL